MKNILHLVKKEYRQLFRDRAYLPMVLIMPIVQLTLFGYTAATNVRDISMGVLDLDRTAESRELVRRFTDSGYFRLEQHLASDTEMGPLLDKGTAKLVLHIPVGFARHQRKNESAPLQCIVDGSNPTTASIILGYATEIVQQYAADSLNQKVSMDLPQVDLRLRVWYNAELDNVNFIVPGIMCTILAMVTTMLTSTAITREREKGTIEQLVVAPIRSWELILGKVIPFMGVGLVDVLLILAVGVFWFHVPVRGSVPLLLILAMLFVSNTLGMGILISTVSRTQQQAMMTTAFLFLPWLLLSGFIFPIENMPKAIQYVTYTIPLRYFLVIIRDITLKGMGITVFWEQVVAMSLLGAGTLTMSILRFRRNLG